MPTTSAKRRTEERMLEPEKQAAKISDLLYGRGAAVEKGEAPIFVGTLEQWLIVERGLKALGCPSVVIKPIEGNRYLVERKEGFITRLMKVIGV